jgi:protein SDA1
MLLTPIRNDTKSISIVALVCFHPIAKVQNAALHFFLGAEEGEDTDSESEDEVNVDFSSP